MKLTLQEFIDAYDKDGTIVLLEGKRKVEPEHREKLVALGKLLATRTHKLLFRSGNADGADQLFCSGAAAENSHRIQVITPYSGHRMKSNLAHETISLEHVDLAGEPEVVYQSKKNVKTTRLVDKYIAGERDQISIKAAYIIRDTIKAIGTSDIKPASFGIFYDDLNEPMSGGTGHTMKVCLDNNIPLIDQTTWFCWLTEANV